MIQQLAVSLFPMLMVLAAAFDLMTMRIPNWISLALTIGFVASAAALGFTWDRSALHLLAGLAVFGLALIAYVTGQIGGGDAKLASATALWIGWEQLLDYGVVTAFAGGVLTLVVFAIGSLDLPPRFQAAPFMRLFAKRENCVPYGVAIAIGGLLIFPHTDIWRSYSLF